MKYLSPFAMAAFGVLLVLHGAAHAPGVIGSWELARFENTSYQPNLLIPDARDALIRVFGFLWLLAGLASVSAGIAVMRHVQWWPQVTTLALILSLVVTMLWWQDARIGLALNLVLLIVMQIRVETRQLFSSPLAREARFSFNVRDELDESADTM